MESSRARWSLVAALACACTAACASAPSGARAGAQDAPSPPAGSIEPSAPPGAEQNPTTAEPAKEESSNWIRGTSQTSYVFRHSSDDSDSDIYEALALDVGDERHDRWTGHADVRFAWDLDGPSQLFGSLADTEDGDFDAQLYDAYAETKNRGAWSDIKLGRQLVYDTPAVVWFDGAYAQTKESGNARWSTGVYGGSSVHEFESSGHGDWLAGVFEEVHATKWTKVRADFMHIEDERASASHSNDLLALALSHDQGGRLRWDAHYSRLEDRDRDLSVGASWYDLEHGLTLQATHYRLLEEQQSLSLELDPFFEQLLTLFPFDETRLSASKNVGDHVQLLGGIDYRHVSDANDVGAFNHDFDREYLTTTFDEMLPAEVTLSLTGEVWNGDGSDFQTWGFDLSRRWKRGKITAFSASLGSFYSLFKFDPFAGSEKDDVRTYYTALRYRIDESRSMQLRYEHEDQDLGDFDLVRWGMTWHF